MSGNVGEPAGSSGERTPLVGMAEHRPRMIPVGGGKGGVGKTFLVANLASTLARLGYRVVAVDADLEGANLHTCVGVDRPRASLADFVAHREEDLGKLLIAARTPNLHIIAATCGNFATPQPGHARRVQMMRQLRQALGHDYPLGDRLSEAGISINRDVVDAKRQFELG